MASHINRVTLLGNVGSDPEYRTTDTTSIARFRFAVTKRWRDKQGAQQERTSWVNVKAFGPCADYVQEFIGKGQRLVIEGELAEERWETNGQKRSALFVYAGTIVPFEPRQEGQAPTAKGNATTQRAAAATAPAGPPKQAPASSTSSAQGDPFEDDIPF